MPSVCNMFYFVRSDGFLTSLEGFRFGSPLSHSDAKALNSLSNNSFVSFLFTQ